MNEKQKIDLILNAIEAQKNSYSPYSNYKVGAALLCNDGKIYLGTNVENAAYGPTNCAERSAVFSAVSHGDREFYAIAIVGGDLSSYAFPCGICRQVLNEFNPEIDVIVGKYDEKQQLVFETHKLSEILPYGFGKSNLQ